MKYVVVSKLAPGTDNSRKALETFLKAGPPNGTQTLYASLDGKTFVNIMDAEEVDMTGSATFAPFFAESVVIPVVDADGAWLEAIQAGQANWA